MKMYRTLFLPALLLATLLAWSCRAGDARRDAALKCANSAWSSAEERGAAWSEEDYRVAFEACWAAYDG